MAMPNENLIKFQSSFVVFSLAILLTLGGCSFSKTSEDGLEEDEAPVADASTDAIPDPGPEDLGESSASAEAPPAPEEDAPPPPDIAEAPETFPDPVAEAAPPALDTAPAPEAPLMAEAPAVPEPAAPSSYGATTEHSVRAGETLMMIAFETYGDLYKWKDIYEANRDVVSDPNAVPAGTVLKLEKPAYDVVIEKNGEKYLIKRGDTLGTISGEVYGTTSKWKKLWENNRQMIKNPDRIFAGFFLYYIPEAPEQNELAPSPLANAADTSDAAPVEVVDDQARVPASASASDGAVAQ